MKADIFLSRVHLPLYCFACRGVRRFETSSPMPVQLLLLHDQWEEGRGEEGLAEGGDEKQLL